MTATTAQPTQIPPRVRALFNGLAVVAMAIVGVGACVLLHDDRDPLNKPAPANAEAIKAGWSSELEPVRRSVVASTPTIGIGSPWSPVVREDHKVYRAIWPDADDHANVIRAYVTDDDQVTTLSITGSKGDEARAARVIVAATMPNEPVADRSNAAEALAALAQAGRTSSTTLHGVTYAVSAGALHFTYRARPAA